ncbi:MAG: zf-HC2 domain-containing protein [Candidatus Gastranaerophilales bacterium]|nr:zf-HC2 domain-containing protein [Candidatus Gastranaerophilales bacterium]MCM1073055.1 zf-HC2 domain-containing protein [Bacteroides sp.]
MKLTCAQMDVLISFYIDGDLSKTLKSQVEDHLRECSNCRAKYDIIKSMLSDLKNSFDMQEEFAPREVFTDASTSRSSQQYRLFKNNLSAYIDNELDTEDNIKIKKFAINNKTARKALEDSYNIKKLLNNSFAKTKSDVKQDFSRSVLKQLELEEEATSGFHPAIKLLIAFTISVLVLTTIVLLSLSV